MIRNTEVRVETTDNAEEVSNDKIQFPVAASVIIIGLAVLMIACIIVIVSLGAY